MGLITDIWNCIVDFLIYVWNNGDLLAFIILAAIGVAAAVCVVTERKPMRSAFYLALVFVTVAVTYYFLEAEFIGIVQLLVYVGAVTVLFAFSIMLTRTEDQLMDGEDSE